MSVSISVVLVHGIRTSATMWRAQVSYLQERGVHVVAVDLPGHGTRMAEPFTIAAAMDTIDAAVRSAAEHGEVLLVGHSMGGIVSSAYLGRPQAAQVAGFMGVSCTAVPRGVALTAYRAAARALNRLPDNGMWLTKQMLKATLPEDTRADFGAGGYALDAQDVVLASLAELDIPAALRTLTMPVWFVNGQYDQLRTHERRFCALVPHAELIVVPRATHLVTAMRPQAFNAALNLAIVTLQQQQGQAQPPRSAPSPADS